MFWKIMAQIQGMLKLLAEASMSLYDLIATESD